MDKQKLYSGWTNFLNSPAWEELKEHLDTIVKDRDERVLAATVDGESYMAAFRLGEKNATNALADFIVTRLDRLDKT